jgi:hypothetical protein
MEKVCWEATCDNCGEGDNFEYYGSFHYPSREAALETIVSDLEWVERDGILLCNGCIENEDYPPEDVEKAVASLIEKVRAERADGSPEHSSCCGVGVRVDSGDEGTSCYVCERCGKPCDARRGSPERGGEGK